MNHQIFRYMQIALAVFFLSFASTSVWAVETPAAGAEASAGAAQSPPKRTDKPEEKGICAPQTKDWIAPDTMVYIVIGVIALCSLVSIKLISYSLNGNEKWSLADAMSEEYQTTPIASDGKPIPDDKGNPQLITEMRASSSRVIALMGMVVILLMFIGFGVFALHGFAKTGCMPESIDKVVSFLYAGVILFAPYAVNKFSKVFENLTPKK